MVLGSFVGGSGMMNMSGGVVNAPRGLVIGEAGAGEFVMTGGTVNVTGPKNGNDTVGTDIGYAGNNSTEGMGTLTVGAGSIFNNENDLRLGFAGNADSQATLNIQNGGVVNIASTTERYMIVGQFDFGDSTVNIMSGGTLNLFGGSDIRMGFQGNDGTRTINVNGGSIIGTGATNSNASLIEMGVVNATSDDILNITNGGLVQALAIFTNAETDSAIINFDNGTLKAVASDANWINLGGTGTRGVNVLSGGANFDTNGSDVTIHNALLGSGDVTKQGSGVLTLLGDSTYTGDTIVEAGTLTIDPTSDTGWFDDDSAVLIDALATLDLQFTGNDVVEFLYLDGVPQSPGIYTSTTPGISGTGGLDVQSLGPPLGLPGDYNGDGWVDAADYTVWRDNLGAPEGDLLNGNGDGGTIGASDYQRWVDNFGMHSGSGSLASSAVPEPGSVVLLLGAAAGGAAMLRRKRAAIGS